MITDNKKMTVKTDGNVSVVHSSVGSYIFEIAATQKVAQSSVLPFYNSSRRLIPLQVQGFNIVPYGEYNLMPDEIRELLDENNLTPEILNKQTQLLWGQGPAQYKIKYENGKRMKVWEENKEVTNWLKTWDYAEYLMKCCVDFRATNGHFTQYFRNRGPRVGAAGKIVELKHQSPIFCRLEWPDDQQNINRIIVGEWTQPWKCGLTTFPIWNKKNPFAAPVAMRYSNYYSFALTNDYSRSPFYGTRHWIALSSSIAKLLTNFNENSSAVKLHIKVPKQYWDDKYDMLKTNCVHKGIEYKDQMLQDLKDETFVKFAETLAGGDNVGKFVTTDKFFDGEAREWVDWVIDPLDQKVKDFIDAQIAISKRAAFETTAGMGLHPALSNISADGNLPSGSEQLYAFKLYLMTGVDIPEEIVCRDINNAIEANFPNADVKIGFYHDVVLTEEATNPKDRIKNQTQKPAENAV